MYDELKKRGGNLGDSAYELKALMFVLKLSLNNTNMDNKR